MSTELTPGRRLRKALDAAVQEAGMEWSPTDLAVSLPAVEDTADRLAELKRHLAAQLAKSEPSLRAVQLATEVRQTDAQLAKMVRDLGIDADDEPAAPKSAQHQAAARTRWDRRSHRQKPA